MMGKLAKVKTAVKIVAIMMTIALILMTRTTDGQKGERVTWQKRRVSAPPAALQLTAVQATLGE